MRALIIIGGGVALAGASRATTLQDLPHGAKAGECFSHMEVPPVYRTDRQPVPQPPRVSWRDIPAVYKTVTRQVLVSPGRVDHERIPAVMGTRMHWVEHPGADHIVTTPAVYRWEVRRVLVRPAHLEWRPGNSSGGYSDRAGYGATVRVQPTGEVMCRIRVPARYEMRRVRVLVTPARDCVVKGPSRRERVVEHFEVTPAHVVDHAVPPVYRTVTERVLVSPARRDRVETPQPPRYIAHRVLVSPAHIAWTKIACVTKPPHAHRSPYYGQGGQPTYAQPRPGGYGAQEPPYRAPEADPSYGSSTPQ